MSDADITNPLAVIVTFFISIFSILVIIVKFAVMPILIVPVVALFFFTMFVEK